MSARRFSRLELELRLPVVSPCLFRGLPGRLMGLDAAALRDEQGRPIIPGDQVRGCLRDAFEDLAAAGTGITAEDLLDLFGRPSRSEDEAGASNEPSRACLIVSDLSAAGLDAVQRLETTRIAIDEDTGAVGEGMMMVLELIAPFGQTIEFKGHATLFAPRGREDEWVKRLDQAVKLVTAIGSVKSAGYGEVVEPAITRRASTEVTLPAAVSVGAGRRYRVTFDRPVLVDAEWIADNAMKGSAIVPGAVLKGALAQMLLYSGEEPAAGPYAAALSALSFSHAFPEGDTRGLPGGRPLPLSLVSSDGRDFGDALLAADGQGALLRDEPALFQTDWKSPWFGAAAQGLGYPSAEDPPLLARTHTAIDHDGVAKDQDLFTTLARGVRRKDVAGAWSDRGWILDVDLSAVASGDAERARRLVALLERGLDGIGKTGARATFEVLGEPSFNVPQEIAGRAGEHAVVLQTAAHMLDARRLVRAEDGQPMWSVSALEAYREYWEAALPGARLESFYASQRYAGRYLARRRRAYGSGHYHPFLVTEPGSVFRLSNVRGATLDRLAGLCRTGLPPAKLDGKPVDWRSCPFVPENGYGRITADHLAGSNGRVLLEIVSHV